MPGSSCFFLSGMEDMFDMCLFRPAGCAQGQKSVQKPCGVCEPAPATGTSKMTFGAPHYTMGSWYNKESSKKMNIM